MEMSWAGCIGILGLICIFEVDRWTDPCIIAKVLGRFVELRMVIKGSSCRELVAWASGCLRQHA
jgi:hypothetical protein